MTFRRILIIEMFRNESIHNFIDRDGTGADYNDFCHRLVKHAFLKSFLLLLCKIVSSVESISVILFGVRNAKNGGYSFDYKTLI